MAGHYGELAAFMTAIFWTVTGLSFEWAGKRVGSLAVNLIRLLMAFVIMATYNAVTRGMWLPFDATPHAWFWLTISGLIGFVIGDLFLFQAYVLIGTRISLLIMACAPPITGVLSYFIFGEKLTMLSMLGMALTLGGIMMVIMTQNKNGGGMAFSHPIKGIAYAFMGAIGQAFGLVSSKMGMGDYNPFAATQIRIIAGIVGFLVIYAIGNHWVKAFDASKDRKAMSVILLGAIFGPFLGVSFSLLSLQYTEAAVASTIMSIMPVLVIPPAMILFKEKVSFKEVLGAVVTVTGVCILFI